MRVMLATDGSLAAGIAAGFVAERTWPAGTSIEVVAALDVLSLLPAPFSPTPADAQPLEDSLRDELHEAIDRTTGTLRARGLDVSASLLTGTPVEVLVRHAAMTGADLIVCGSRGQGELAVLMLGSVSAGLADRAPCPVLVARRTTLSHVLLADDGTGPAIAAEDAVVSWPLFEDVPIEVLSVAHVPPAWRAALARLAPGGHWEHPHGGIIQARERAGEVLDHALARLAGTGRTATGVHADGDPPGIILAEAEATAIDLIVVGTHGRHGWDRLMLGSTARAVLLHAHASVLVVRPAHTPAQISQAAA